MPAAQPLIRTARLRLSAPQEQLAEAVLDFHQRNRQHLARWDPPRDERFFTPFEQRDRLAASARAFAEGTGFAYWLSRRSRPRHVIGMLHFSNVVRGAFHSAMVGYSLDAQEQGKGLMHEALAAGIGEMFSERVWLHRLQANVRPENLRSRALLARAGFSEEGLARHYLYIDGAWRHHVMTALLNPRFNGAPPS